MSAEVCARCGLPASEDQCAPLSAVELASALRVEQLELPYGKVVFRDVQEIAEALRKAEGERDNAYAERNKVVAGLARIADLIGLKVGVGKHVDDPSAPIAWSAEWRNVVFIDLPTGQASWHVHDSDLPLFGGLPVYAGTWDGHTTDEKYERISALKDTYVRRTEIHFTNLPPARDASTLAHLAESRQDGTEAEGGDGT